MRRNSNPRPIDRESDSLSTRPEFLPILDIHLLCYQRLENLFERTDKPIISLHVEKLNIGGNPFANIICRIESFPLPDEARLTIAGIPMLG